ncbi:hypothetical protein [Asticcacaulis solisilvae]|uniref:hypothetical protein n=1 Tax=Asticcacaulis solisilvae TaxID=1217274 RepID=UPI003FD70BE7
MKYPVFCLAAVGILGLGGCSIDTVTTAWHWRDFAGTPDAAHFKPLHDDLTGCRTADCSQGEWVADKDVEALVDRVKARNRLALQVAMAGYSLTRDHGLATKHLDAAVSNMAQTDAKAFLSAAAAEKATRSDFVSQFGSQLSDDYDGQYQALVARRAAISAVADPALEATKAAYIVILDKAIAEAEKSRIALPAPQPVP